jgi:hypothetical protein
MCLLRAWLSFLLGLAINQVILLLVHRIRPYDAGISHLLIALSADPSFPSDHATATFAIAAAFLLHGMRRVGFWFLAAALLVTVSRVYIGTHYVSDAWGSADRHSCRNSDPRPLLGRDPTGPAGHKDLVRVFPDVGLVLFRRYRFYRSASAFRLCRRFTAGTV